MKKQTAVEWLTDQLGIDGGTMRDNALAIERVELIRADKLETLAKLLAKCWFYCDWRWENPNERVMQMLMQDLGLYPFKDEDEMIQQTKIDEGLDKQLYKEASMRIPTYGKLSEDIVESKIEDDVEVHPLEILRNKIKNEIGKPMMSSSYYGGYKQGLIEVENMVMDMLAQFPQQKENTYTEEQVMEAIEMAKKQLFIYTSEEIIISLKQPK